MQAAQWQMNPFAVAQKTHLINGVLGYEAQLVNAVISRSGVLASRFDYEWYGPWEKVVGKFHIRKGDKGEYRVPGWTLADEAGIGIIIRATLKGEDQPRELDLLLAQARTRNSTLWADDPRQQLAYLAVKRWARLFCPDVILGVYTPDELDDRREEREVTLPQGEEMRLINRGSKQSPLARQACEIALAAHQQRYGDYGRSKMKETYTVRVEGVKVWVEVVNCKASYVATAMTGMRRLRSLPGQAN